MRKVNWNINITSFCLASITFICMGSAHDLLAATSSEIQEWLQAHNKYRTLHGVANVTWSAHLAQKAQDWADTCPSGHSTYGENILFANFSKDPEDVVARWYREESVYDYNNPGFSISTGHFTQVVWKNSSEIGCGYKAGCSGSWSHIWICQYNPPGNVYGQFAANVLPPRSVIDSNQDFLPATLMLLLFN